MTVVEITIIKGPEAGLARLFEQDRITLGRSAQADFLVPDRGASRVHAELVLHEGELYLRDLDSRHGTFLAVERDWHHLHLSTDTRVVRLEPEAIIAIGTTQMRVVLDPELEPEAPLPQPAQVGQMDTMPLEPAQRPASDPSATIMGLPPVDREAMARSAAEQAARKADAPRPASPPAAQPPAAQPPAAQPPESASAASSQTLVMTPVMAAKAPEAASEARKAATTARFASPASPTTTPEAAPETSAAPSAPVRPAPAPAPNPAKAAPTTVPLASVPGPPKIAPRPASVPDLTLEVRLEPGQFEPWRLGDVPPPRRTERPAPISAPRPAFWDGGPRPSRSRLGPAFDPQRALGRQRLSILLPNEPAPQEPDLPLSARFCIACGDPLFAEARFCGHCGTPV